VGKLLAGGSAGGVVVVGAAGVGKTRLAGEVADLAEAGGCAVEWVRATRSAASIPLGAFAALLPGRDADADFSAGAELLARVRGALAERAGERRLVLCVDDGQLLDVASAALVHQLVAAGEAFAVVTLRRGEPVADALRALWKDELCTLVELDELSRDEVEWLLAAALGNPVDGRTLAALWELTRGNALFLREMVHYGLERGDLTDEGRVWRWRGEMAAGLRLAELVGARLEALDTDERSALEVIAVGAPLEIALLDAGETAALEALERHEVVEGRGDGRRRVVDVAHPLHGEVLRTRLSRTRLEAIQRRLADAVEARGARRRGDLLRLAAWQLESGATGDPALFADAARAALSAHDWPLALRLARAALQAGGGFGAQLTLARSLAGRAAEAEELFARLEPQATTDSERAAVAIGRASNLSFGLGRPADADKVLLRAEQMITDRCQRDDVVAARAWLLCGQGQPLPALAVARPLLTSDDTREQARVRAAMATATALAMQGRTGEAISVAEATEPAARAHRDELPLLEAQLLRAQGVALLLAGRLVEATGVAERMYGLDLSSRAQANTAVAAYTLGSAWLARGRVATALRWFSESAALLREDDIGGLRHALGGAVQATAQAGDAAAARQTVEEMDRAPSPANRVFGYDDELAHAWSAAAGGELSRARELAVATADLAQARGQDGLAVRALHEACRLGDPETTAPRLAELADRVDGPLVATAAAHAAALLARDGAALQEVAERFADMDALLVAAEAGHAAAAAFRGAGREASARAAAARAGVWLEQCEGARPVTLPAAEVADELTPREREIALLAASGLTSQQIAGRLVVSVRTVDNHLQRVYRKLGIARRGELAGLITPD
jgi:DNA-binding CsgD family transcriptional regulator